MNITIIFITLTVVAWIAFDLYIIAKKGKYFSISASIIRATYKYPMIPFLVGFLCGHLFWKMNDKDIYKKLSTDEKKSSKIN